MNDRRAPTGGQSEFRPRNLNARLRREALRSRRINDCIMVKSSIADPSALGEEDSGPGAQTGRPDDGEPYPWWLLPWYYTNPSASRHLSRRILGYLRQ
jgi:hypothetical protein